MIKVTFNGFKSVNIENEFQLSFMKGNIGAEVSRTKLEEQIQFENIEYHPDNKKFQKTLYPFLFFQGKIKVGCEWTDEEGITQEDVDFGIELAKNYSEYNPEMVETTANSFSYISDYNISINEWQERSLQWELVANKSHIKAIEDDTIIVCVMPNPNIKDFVFKNVDIKPNETIETEKLSGINFLLVSQKCEVKVPFPDVVNEYKIFNFDAYDVKKLKSKKCFIKNVSDKTCRAVIICRTE